MTKEYKIGIIVLCILAFSIWGVNFLKGRSLITSEKEYYGVFSEIGGLEASSNVLINGVKVGRVNRIDFINNDPSRILVAFTIPSRFKVPADSKIEIYSTDLLGSKALALIIGKAPHIAETQDTLQSGVQPDLIASAVGMLKPISEKAEQMLISMDSVMKDLHATLDPDTRAGIQNSIRQLEEILENEKTKIAAILSNLESVTAQFKDSNQDIANITGNFSSLSDELAEARMGEVVKKADQALQELELLLKNINQGKGSLGQLAVNDALYRNLNQSVADLDSLFLDLKQNPKRYVHFSLFGNRNKEERK